MESLAKATKKIGSSFLAFCLAISMMPINAFADTISETPTKVEISASEEIKLAPNGSTHYYVIGSKEDDTFKLNAKISPDGVSQDVTWTSDKTGNNITIDDEGNVTVGDIGANPIYATFTATSKEAPSIKGTYSIYILTPMKWAYSDSDSVEITLPEDGTMPQEDEYFSTEPYQYENYKIVEWTSQDTNIATVRSNGNVCFVVGVRPGKTTVLGENKEVKSNSLVGNVTVKGVAVEAKDGSKSAKTITGESIDLVAYGEKEDSKFTWVSSNDEIATVDNNGKVTTLKEGSVLITATDENGAKGGFKVNVIRSENAPYLDNLELMNYTTFKDWTSYTSNFGTSKLNYKLETKNSSAGSLTVRLKASYDESKYKVDVLKNGELYKTYEKTATEIAPPVDPGDSKIVIRVTDLNDKDNYTDYTFDVTRTRHTDATLSTTTVTPGNKAVNTVLLYKGKAEGTLFRLNASTGEVTNTSGFTSSIYGYRAYLFNDADSFVLTPKLKDSNAKLKMSIDGGEMVDVVSGKALDPIKFGDKKEVEVKLFGCSDATYYANQQAGKEDPFEVESTYTITVERTNIDSDVLDNVKILSADISNGTWCTPKFNKNLSSAAVLVDEDCTSLDITFKVKEGAKVYDTSVSDKNLINPNEDGTYTLSVQLTKNKIVKLTYDLEDGTQLLNTYTFITYKKGKLAGMPDNITDYFCPGSQYSNMSSYGMYPEKSLTGSGSWSSPISLGNFGGYITYYYDKAIKNDPTNPYGIDFTVFGNSNGGQGFSEPGNVIVSKDGVNWYTLAGSEHYDEHAIWGYELTYIRNGSTTACSYKDNLGGSADMTTMYKFPLKENYPLYKFNEDADKQVTVSGTLLVNNTKDLYGSSSALYPDFGYVDVHRNSSTVGGTGENVDLLTVPVGNPYTGSYDQYGDGFDIDWAVDENGYPVKLDEIHYVKVQTASFIMAGAIGEKSTEVNSVTRTFGEKEVGKTTAPTSIKVGDKTIELKEGVNTYNVEFPENFDVTVNASEDANVYINSKRGNTRTYTAAPEKGIIRIIVQEGEKEPVIYYLTNKKVETKTTVTFDADNGTEAVVKEVAEDGTLDYTPENPTKKGYIFVGWYKDVDNTTTGYKSSQTYTESTTYKAKWAHVNMLGAQAKSVVDGKGGIRFATKVYKDGDEVIEKGTLIIPANLLKGEALTLDTAKAAKSIATVDYQQKEDYVVYLGTIVNIPQNQFNREMTATSYVKYRDKSGNEYIVYSPYARGSVTINQLLEGFM